MAIVFTPVPFLRSQYEFGEGDVSGSITAHQGLALAAVRSGLVSEIAVLPERFNPAVGARTQQLVESSVSALEPMVRASIRLRSIAWLMRQLQETPGNLIGLGRSVDLPDLIQLRSACPTPMPLVGIVHSVLFPSIAMSLQAMLIGCRPCDALIATSSAAQLAITSLLEQARANIATVLPEALRLDIPRIERIPLGVEDDFCYTLDRAACRRQMGIPAGAQVLLFVGRLSESYKASLEVLASLLTSLREEYPSLHLVLAGSTVHGTPEHFAAAISQHAATPIIIPNFPRMAKKAVYCAADIFVSPVDNIQESYGLSILEAMASGLPVVAANWSGYRDLVREGETGFLIDTAVDDAVWSEADALASFAFTPLTEGAIAKRTVVDLSQLTQRIRQLLSDEQLRARMGAAGLARVQSEFMWSHVIRRFGSIWDGQLARASKNCIASAPTLRMKDAFGHYASSLFRPELTVVDSSLHAPMSFRRRFPGDSMGFEMLERCAGRPAVLQSLLQTSDYQMRGKIYQMIKLGYLRMRTVGGPETL